MSADRQSRRRIDIVALIAGLLFLSFSVASLTVGVLDLPRFGAAPLWVLLIGAGVVLLISELRGRTSRADDSVEASTSAERGAWEQDRYS